MLTFLTDLRYSLRTLRKSSVFTFVAVVTLTLGVGANAAIFSVVKAVLLNQLPYAEPDRLVALAETDSGSIHPETIGYATAYDWRRLSHSFESMSLYRDYLGALVQNGEPDLLSGLRVNYGFFDTLGVRLQLGRPFLPEEDHPDTRHEAILSDTLWKRRFNADPNIVGRVIHLSESAFTVVGVLPPGFRTLEVPGAASAPELFLPLGYDLSLPYACRDCQHLHLIARLKRGVTVSQAHAELNTIMSGLVQQFPGSYPPTAAVAIEPLHGYIVDRVSAALWILLGAVGFVLLIACANVANLMLARGAGRAREMALRAALGAGRTRLIRQLLTESLVLALAGGIGGVLLAWRCVSALAIFGPTEIPRVNEVSVDATVLIFSFGTSLFTGLLFGLVPALRASHTDLNEALKDLSKTTSGRMQQAVRNLLVVSEIALAFVLVVGAGLLAKSFTRLLNVDPGYDAHHVLSLGIYVYGARYQKPQAELNYYRQVLERLRATPGIESAAMTSELPMADFDRRGFHIRDRRPKIPSDVPSADTYSVSPDYFRVVKIPLQRGRFFNDADDARAPKVAIISETCAREQFPGEDAIGKQIQLGGRDDEKPWATIVGIVGDIHQYGLDLKPNIAAYIAQAQDISFSYSLVTRTTLDPRLMESTVRAAFLAVDPTQPVFRIKPLESYLASSLAQRRFTLELIALFGFLALALAAVGIYGVIAYSVTLRTREIGIRMALGAERRTVLAMVLRTGATLTLAGLTAGFLAALALTRLLESLLFEVHATDLRIYLAVAAILSGIALLASYLPARRAATVDPLVALRYE